MSGTSLSVHAKANCRNAKNCVRTRKNLRTDAVLVTAMKRVFPFQTAFEISELIDIPQRTVEYWFAGGKIPADALAELMRSDHGNHFVAAIMVDSRAAWWRQLCSWFTAVDALRLHRAAKRKLEEAFDEARKFDAMALPGAALSVHDEDFMRPHLDAMRAAERPHDPHQKRDRALARARWPRR